MQAAGHDQGHGEALRGAAERARERGDEEQLHGAGEEGRDAQGEVGGAEPEPREADEQERQGRVVVLDEPLQQEPQGRALGVVVRVELVEHPALACGEGHAQADPQRDPRQQHGVAEDPRALLARSLLTALHAPAIGPGRALPDFQGSFSMRARPSLRPRGAVIRNYSRDLAAAGPSARAYLWGSALVGIGGGQRSSPSSRGGSTPWAGPRPRWGRSSRPVMGQGPGRAPAAILVARRPVRSLFVGAAAIQGLVWLAMPWLAEAGEAALPLLSVASLVAGIAGTVHYIAIAPFLFRTAPAQARAGLFGLAEATQTLSAVVAASVVGLLVDALVSAGTAATPALGMAAAEADAGLPVLTLAGLASFGAADVRAHPRGCGLGARAGRPRPRGRAPARGRHRAVRGAAAAHQLGCRLLHPFLPLYFKDRFRFEPAAWGGLFASGQVLERGAPAHAGGRATARFVRSQVASSSPPSRSSWSSPDRPAGAGDRGVPAAGA